MSEKTVRIRLKSLGLILKVSTEMYSGAKCYAVMEHDRPIFYFQSLDDLCRLFKNDF